MADLLIHKARFTSRGKTVTELQQLATEEFTRLYEGQRFTMQTTGPAQQQITDRNGRVFAWEQEYEAVNG